MPIEKYAGKDWEKHYENKLFKLEPFTEGFERQKMMADILYKDNIVYSLQDKRKDSLRAHPDLIEVVEKMKEKANGRHAKLKIVKIPDDVEWEIEEYDGTEWVSEKHRRWE